MKATLEFQLPDEAPEFHLAVNGAQARSVIIEIDNYLRQRIKYEELNEQVYDALQKTRDYLRELDSNE